MKSQLCDIDVDDCTGSLYYAKGGSTDKWGLSQANIDTYVRDQKSTFGVAFRLEEDLDDDWLFDGAQVTVYYTEPVAGYPHYVNQTLIQTDSVNQTQGIDIYSVNQTT